MRDKIIDFLKKHPNILGVFWKVVGLLFTFIGFFVPCDDKRVIFASFGGRKFDDSPKALYEAMMKNEKFYDYTFIWTFVSPDDFEIPNAIKVKIDTPKFLWQLLRSRIWISNSGMDRGLNIRHSGCIKVETWHGTPLKKIGGDENMNSMLSEGAKNRRRNGKVDDKTIRCAQSEFDRTIFTRIFNASKESILLSDLPRNDSLLRYTQSDINSIKKMFGIDGKKVILYIPTYREYLSKEGRTDSIPIDLKKWEKALGNKYVVLFRAHYAVKKAMCIEETSFIRDVSNYPLLNDLYAVSDIMISDYSSCYFDYSILDRPMLCYAYDLKEYSEKRGLYLNLQDTLPCVIDENEDDLLSHILDMNEEAYSENTAKFHSKYAPYAGDACNTVISEIIRRM